MCSHVWQVLKVEIRTGKWLDIYTVGSCDYPNEGSHANTPSCHKTDYLHHCRVFCPKLYATRPSVMIKRGEQSLIGECGEAVY